MSPDPQLRQRRELEAQHTPEAIRRRLRLGPQHSYLRDFIYGAMDGVVTTFAIVAGVAGAQLSGQVVLILGAANLLADGLSMAAGNYLGTRAELQERNRLRDIEQQHIAQYPKGEREEVRQIFQAKGFEGPSLEHAVEVITADTNRWIDTMLKEELGLSATSASPVRAAAVTFGAFIGIGIMPLLVFIYQAAARADSRLDAPYVWSTAMTGLTFFIVGAFKGRFVAIPWFVSGLETLLIGSAAAAVAYGVGAVLTHVVS